MTTLFLLRHGRTVANSSGILAGHGPVELDEVGVEQARAAAIRLSGLTFAAAVSSPLARCRQTISIALPSLDPAVDEGLTECGYGQWSGRKLSELAEEPLWRVVQTHPSAAVFPGGEAMAAMAARAVGTVRRWNETVGPQACWLACSHGDIIKAIVADALGMHLDQFQRIQVSPGSITVIRYAQERAFLMRLSDDGAPLTATDRSTSSDAVVGGAGV